MNSTTILSKEEILSLPRGNKRGAHCCGVYFLIFGGEIVYVGASTKCASRAYGHRRGGQIQFDSFTSIPVPKSERFAAERLYTAALCPRHNKNNNPACEVKGAGGLRPGAGRHILLPLYIHIANIRSKNGGIVLYKH